MESRLERLRLDMQEGKPVLKKDQGAKVKQGTAGATAEDSADQSDEGEGRC